MLRVRAALSDRYRVDRAIGRGGMGTVFLAQDLKHGRQVAVKVLNPDLGLGPERFLREIEIAASLAHPHILPVHDSGTADGLLFYVMPYVDGESLRERLHRQTQLSVEEALVIVREVGDALAFAHRRGVVHRDIKPENILLEADHAVVTDFGLARAVSGGAGRLTDPGLAVGTPAYMSPEQAAGVEEVDGRSDQYSLACLLYEMLVGHPPFTGPTPQAVLARQVSDTPPSLRTVRPTVSLHLEEVVGKALAKVPADRYGGVSQFVAAIGATSAEVAVQRPRTAPWIWTAAAVAAAAVAAAAAVGYLALRPASARPGLGAPESTGHGSSIAVMYLEDLSEDGGLAHLAAGLTEDLIDRLAAVQALRVISPDGVRPYRGTDVPLDSVARTFGVGTVVTGSVSRDAERLRVTVRLTDATSGVQIHGQSFERALDDVLTLRDQMTEEVAGQLRVRIGEAVQLRERRAGTAVAGAWERVRQGERIREEIMTLADRDSSAASALFEQAETLLAGAERLDPAWVAPVVVRGWLAYDQAGAAMAKADTSSAASGAAAWIDRGMRHAARALRLRDGAPEALELRGSLRYRGWAFAGLAGRPTGTAELAAAEADLRRAGAVPGPKQARALSLLSVVLQFSGKVAESNLAAQRAYEADAYLSDASAIVLRLFDTSLELGRYSEAAQWCERGRQAFPREWTFLMCRLSLMAWSPEVRPDVPTAWAILAEIDTVAPAGYRPWLRPQMTMLVAAVVGAAGLRDSAVRIVDRARAVAPSDPELPYYEALARVRLGQPHEAAGQLAKFLGRSPNFEAFLRSHSAFEPLWTDPRLRTPARSP